MWTTEKPCESISTVVRLPTDSADLWQLFPPAPRAAKQKSERAGEVSCESSTRNHGLLGSAMAFPLFRATIRYDSMFKAAVLSIALDFSLSVIMFNNVPIVPVS